MAKLTSTIKGIFPAIYNQLLIATALLLFNSSLGQSITTDSFRQHKPVTLYYVVDSFSKIEIFDVKSLKNRSSKERASIIWGTENSPQQFVIYGDNVDSLAEVTKNPDGTNYVFRKRLKQEINSGYFKLPLDENILEKTDICVFHELELGGFISYGLGRIKKSYFVDCKIDSINFSLDSINLISRNSHVRKIRCNLSDIESLILLGKIDTLYFTNSNFINVPIFRLEKNPVSISLQNCRFKFDDIYWDLDNLFPEKRDTKCLLNLLGTDVSKLKFSYADYIIDTHDLSFEQTQTIYTNLKEQYRKLGMIESLQLVDIDLTKLNNRNRGFFYKVADLINFQWWKYGYDKGMVVINSIFLFSLFLLANLSFGLTRLLIYAYSLPFYNQILDKIDSRKNVFVKTWFRFWYVFLYTCLVFWGLNLDKKELKYENLGYLTYIIFQYLVGLICLAYLATYILSK